MKSKDLDVNQAKDAQTARAPKCDLPPLLLHTDHSLCISPSDAVTDNSTRTDRQCRMGRTTWRGSRSGLEGIDRRFELNATNQELLLLSSYSSLRFLGC